MHVTYAQKIDTKGIKWVVRIPQGASWRYYRDGWREHELPGQEEKKGVKS
jgi:hypothetical protein